MGVSGCTFFCNSKNTSEVDFLIRPLKHTLSSKDYYLLPFLFILIFYLVWFKQKYLYVFIKNKNLLIVAERKCINSLLA